MALRGVIQGSLTQRTTYYRPMLYWTATQNIENNTSTIRLYSFVDDYPTSSDGTPYTPPMDWNGTCSSYQLTIDGQQITHGNFTSNSDSGWTYVGYTAVPYYDIAYGAYRSELISEAWASYHEFTVAHNSDGTKSVGISHSYSLGSSGYGPGNVSFSATITLDTIPRASLINSFDAFTIDDATTKNITVRTTSYSTSFNLDFTLKYGGTTIASWSNITPTVGAQQTHTLSLSIAQQQALMNLITTASTGTVTMELVTQSGSTQIGDTKSLTTTASIAASIVPTISSFTNTELTTSPINIATVVGKYVKLLSNIRFAGAGAGKYGSTITSYVINYNGSNYGVSTLDTGLINWSGDKVVTLTVTDSRGRTAQSQVTVNSLDYATPVISSFIVVRCTSGGVADPLGTYVKVTRVGTASSLINSTQRNTVAAKIFYKDRAGVSPAAYTEIANMAVAASTNVSGAVALPAIVSASAIADATKSYDFKFELTDKFYTTTSLQSLPTGSAIMSWGSAGVGFGKFPGAGYAVDVAGKVNVNPDGSGNMGYYENGVRLSRFEKNWIMNGGFDVCQRGTMRSLPNDVLTYEADRWFDGVFPGGGTMPALTRLISDSIIDNKYVKFSRVSFNGAGTIAAGSLHVYVQSIERGVKKLCGSGKKVSVSFWARSDVSGKKLGFYPMENYGSGGSPTGQEYITGNFVTLTNIWTKYTATFTTNTLVAKTFGTNNDDRLNLEFMYMWGTGYAARCGDTVAETYRGAGYVDISNVCLVQGDIPTDYVPESYESVLCQCQRYCYAVESSEGIWTYYGTGLAISATQAKFLVPLPVTMRKAPTLTGAATMIVADEYGGSWIVNGITCGNNSSRYSAVVVATVASGLTVYRPLVLAANNTLASYLVLECDF